MVTAIATRFSQEPRTQGLLDRLGRHCPGLLTHGVEVAVLSVRIGHLLGLDEARLTLLARAALLHDIGKQYVPVEILEKPGKLDAREWAIIERHPMTGHRVLVGVGLVAEARIVLHHHERFDGGGYPTGRAGTGIPLESRILAVADSFDAMTSHRPYREALSPQDAVAELLSVAGRQCDPACVEALAGLVLR